MKSGSAEFTTWVALAFAAIAVAICATFSSSAFALIAAGLVGAFLGYQAERVSRRYIEQYLSKKRLR
jgi:chromate transport protein ChrA